MRTHVVERAGGMAGGFLLTGLCWTRIGQRQCQTGQRMIAIQPTRFL
jgi:hypothetical protein